jgi:hypothetical protein
MHKPIIQGSVAWQDLYDQGYVVVKKDEYMSHWPTQGWQPIETAPKDGTLILLHRSDGSISPFEDDTVVVGKWIAGPWQDGSESKFIFGSHYYIDEDNRKTTFHIVTATHWMPLPEPPK